MSNRSIIKELVLKKIYFVVLALLIAMVFAGCASKNATKSGDIPRTVEGRTEDLVYIPVTDLTQIYGKWESTVVINHSEVDFGIPNGLVIEPLYSLELPVEIDGVECAVYTFVVDYTSFIDEMYDLYVAEGIEGLVEDPDWLWEIIKQSEPQYEYSEGRPYIMTASEYIEITDDPISLNEMYLSEDGTKLKITDGITMDFIFDKVN